MPRLIRLWSFARVKCNFREGGQFVGYETSLFKNIMSMPLRIPYPAIVVVGVFP